MSAPPPSAPTDTPPGGGPPPPPRRRLTRRREGRLLAGVASGVAAHLDVDPVLVRVGFVVLGFVPFPGFGLLLYVVLAVLLPADDTPENGAVPAAPASGRGLGFYVGIGLVALAGLWLLGPGGGLWVFGPGGGRGGLFPLLLIGLGIALWVDADRRGGSRRPPASGPEPAPAAASWTPPAPSASTAVGVTTATVPPAAPARTWAAPPPPQRPPRSPLGRLTLGLALLTAGGVWSLHWVLGVRVTGVTVLASALLVVGLGLLVGSVFGRARWLAIVAVPLALATLAGSTLVGLGVPLRHGVGQRVVAFEAAEDFAAPLQQTGGQMLIDLRELEPGADPPTVTARLGGGEMEVLVPEGAGLTGTLRVEAGNIVVFGVEYGGVAVTRSLDRPAEPGQPTYDLDLHVFAGEIIVRSTTPDWHWSER